jgi:hypothetical protein
MLRINLALDTPIDAKPIPTTLDSEKLNIKLKK